MCPPGIRPSKPLPHSSRRRLDRNGPQDRACEIVSARAQGRECSSTLSPPARWGADGVSGVSSSAPQPFPKIAARVLLVPAARRVGGVILSAPPARPVFFFLHGITRAEGPANGCL